MIIIIEVKQLMDLKRKWTFLIGRNLKVTFSHQKTNTQVIQIC